MQQNQVRHACNTFLSGPCERGISYVYSYLLFIAADTDVQSDHDCTFTVTILHYYTQGRGKNQHVYTVCVYTHIQWGFQFQSYTGHI